MGCLRKRIKMKAKVTSLVGSGRKHVSSKEAEEDLAMCICTLCNLGFGTLTNSIKDFVKDFVKHHGMKNPFKNDKPGKNWLKKFICVTRISITSNPFVVYDFLRLN